MASHQHMMTEAKMPEPDLLREYSATRRPIKSRPSPDMLFAPRAAPFSFASI